MRTPPRSTLTAAARPRSVTWPKRRKPISLWFWARLIRTGLHCFLVRKFLTPRSQQGQSRRLLRSFSVTLGFGGAGCGLLRQGVLHHALHLQQGRGLACPDLELAGALPPKHLLAWNQVHSPGAGAFYHFCF